MGFPTLGLKPGHDGHPITVQPKISSELVLLDNMTFKKRYQIIWLDLDDQCDSFEKSRRHYCQSVFQVWNKA